MATMIAMAIALDPDLLIADRPFTALDVTVQAQILKVLLDVRDRFGMAIMLITHDLGVVAGVADRVVVMYAGQKIEEADVHTLFGNPALCRGLLGSTRGWPAAPEAMIQIPGAPPSFRPRRPAASPYPLLPTSSRCAAPSTRRCVRPPGPSISPPATSRSWTAGSRRPRPGAGDEQERRSDERRHRAGSGFQRSGRELVRVTDLVKHFPITSGVFIQRQVAVVHAVDGISSASAGERTSDSSARPTPKSRPQHGMSCGCWT